MYTVSNQKFRALLLVSLIIAGCSGGSHQQAGHDLTNKIALLDHQNVLLYIPNSYLTEMIGRVIQNAPTEIYDPNIYRFYSLENQQATASTKTFKLKLLRKNAALFKNKSAKMAPDAISAQLKSYYAAQNFMERKFTLKVINQHLIGECEGLAGPIRVIDLPIADMALQLVDSTLVHQQKGTPSLLFTEKALIAHYSDNQDFVKVTSAELDTKVEYQNAGCSAVYPFQFMSNFMDTTNVAYAGRTPLEKGLRIYKVKLKRLNSQQVEAKFAIYHKLFPADITGRIHFSSDQNRILTFPAIGYDQSVVLSNAEKAFMANKVDLIKTDVIPDLINKSLAPSFSNAQLELIRGGKKIATPIRHARLSYSGESVIFSIDVI